jgi:hypothetical protein
MTAIEIQRHYLVMAEAHCRDAFMPPWAPQFCEHWRHALDLLDRGPGAAAKAFDWQIKLALFTSHAARKGLDWSRLAFWHAVVERMQHELGLAANGEPFPLDLAISAETPIPFLVHRIEALLRRKGLEWDELRQILELRNEFFEIDTRFGQLGPHGIFSMLDADQVLDHRVSGIDNIEYAMRNPPSKGRAMVRGAVVKRLAGDLEGNWYCSWEQILSLRHGRTLDLSDPFTEAEDWHDGAALAGEGHPF